MNHDAYLDWTLQDKASKTTEIVVDIVENHLSRLLGQGVVSLHELTTRNNMSKL